MSQVEGSNDGSGYGGGMPPQHSLGSRSRLISWIVGVLVLVLIVAGAIWLSQPSATTGPAGKGGAGKAGGRRRAGGGGGAGGAGGANGPATVGNTKATSADLPVIVEALGTVTPAATVTVTPQVSGTIVKLLYREGQLVKKGQLLALIDPRPYQAALVQAQGALIRDQAQLANAQVQLSRYQTLLGQDSIARQDVDTQAAQAKQLAGTIEVDKGVVQQAQINLGFTKVVSPVTGRVGLKVVDVGNYISAGSTSGIVVVTTLQPIDIEFAVPQDSAPVLGQRAAQGAAIPAIALDRTRTQTLDQGMFSTLNNQVDPTTGTIKGKARFANADNQLYPSQFVNIRLTVNTICGAVTIPPAAVRSGQDGSFVWLLQSDKTVTQRKVVTGIATADKIQIVSGLTLGDTVVTDGGDRLTEGAKVALAGPGGPGAGGGKGGKGRHRRGGDAGAGAGGDASSNAVGGGQGGNGGTAGPGGNSGQGGGHGGHGGTGGQGADAQGGGGQGGNGGHGGHGGKGGGNAGGNGGHGGHGGAGSATAQGGSGASSACHTGVSGSGKGGHGNAGGSGGAGDADSDNRHNRGGGASGKGGRGNGQGGKGGQGGGNGQGNGNGQGGKHRHRPDAGGGNGGGGQAG